MAIGAPQAGLPMAQGLPNPTPQGGFTPGPSSNRFGSWGSDVEAGSGHGGIPGDTSGLQQTGNNFGKFNQGDSIAPPPPKPPNAPYTPSAPARVPPPPPPPTTTTSTTSNNTSYAPPVPTFGSITPPPSQPKTYNAPGGSGGGTEAQWNAQGYRIVNGVPYASNSPILAKGGAIPALADGGEVGASGADDPMGGVRQAVSMARSQFGLSDAAFHGMSQQFAGGQSAGGQQASPAGGTPQAARGGSIPALAAGGGLPHRSFDSMQKQFADAQQKFVDAGGTPPPSTANITPENPSGSGGGDE